jgi:ABC-2 type transport system permease protein/lipopolysaccharide transport system permease protein
VVAFDGWGRLRSTAGELAALGIEAQRWWTLAWADTRFRYRRTTFGPFWITLSMAATVFSVGLVFGTLFGNDLSVYLPYFAVGLIAWTFISQCILEGSLVYVQCAGYIKSTPVPLALHVYRLLGRQLILLGHNAVLPLGLWLVFRWQLSAVALLALPGLAIGVVALLGAMLALSIVCARYRDLYQIVSALMSLLFLLTPIIWMPGSVRSPGLDAVVYANPFHHLVEIVRQPLLGTVPALGIWLTAATVALLSLGAGVAIHARLRYRVVYWL